MRYYIKCTLDWWITIKNDGKIYLFLDELLINWKTNSSYERLGIFAQV